jgi:hypothetical protein
VINLKIRKGHEHKIMQFLLIAQVALSLQLHIVKNMKSTRVHSQILYIRSISPMGEQQTDKNSMKTCDRSIKFFRFPHTTEANGFLCVSIF